MKNKYVIVISFDAVSEEDLEFLSKQPNFSKLIKNGALIKNVESVYPSLTYPAHATIVTGKYPKNHGVINNTVLYCIRKYSGELKWDTESKEMKFFNLDDLPPEQNDPDLVEVYKKSISKLKK